MKKQKSLPPVLSVPTLRQLISVSLDSFQETVMAKYASQSGAKTAAIITQLGDDYPPDLEASSRQP